MLEAADETLERPLLSPAAARFLCRNALVAMNDGDPSLLEPVALHAGHPDWLLRAHAVWALARIGGAAVLPVLEQLYARERHPEVRAELKAELGGT